MDKPRRNWLSIQQNNLTAKKYWKWRIEKPMARRSQKPQSQATDRLSKVLPLKAASRNRPSRTALTERRWTWRPSIIFQPYRLITSWTRGIWGLREQRRRMIQSRPEVAPNYSPYPAWTGSRIPHSGRCTRPQIKWSIEYLWLRIQSTPLQRVFVRKILFHLTRSTRMSSREIRSTILSTWSK